MSAVAKPKRQTTPLLAMLEGRPAKYVAGSLVAHLSIVFLLSQVAVEDSGASIDLSSREQLSFISKLNAFEQQPPDEPEPTDQGDTGEGEGQASMAMELEEGRAGDPKHPSEQSQLRVKDNKVEPRLSREEVIEQARQAGILGSTRLRDNITAMTSNLDFSSGFDPDNVYGAYDSVDGPGSGTFGTGRSNDGRGGGCFSPPCGIIGTGRYRTIPIGKTAGDGYWTGNTGNPGGRQHLAQAPSYSYPKEISGGTLDKSIIKRYIKRSEASIGYCYEKELLARPGIAGTVTIQFLISSSGGVQSSAGQGFDANVATCVASVIKNINFPAPRDGSAVTVNYPFTFRAAGQ